MAEQQHRIRVCLKCRSYIILNPTYENQTRLRRFDETHIGHPLITTNYSEIDALECGKVVCEDDDPRDELDLVQND
jgi:hypothetical protein